MNFLAHAYLSFSNPQLLTGNMISDFVKGRQKFSYPAGVQKGIELHRLIDQFTDSHSEIRRAKEIFASHYRLYASPIIDVCMDYFLANDQSVFQTENALSDFCNKTYSILDQQQQIFPESFKMQYPNMKTFNWLYNYRTLWGIEKSLAGLFRRARYMNDYKPAFEKFNENLVFLNDRYRAFFPQLEHEARRFIQKN